MLYIRTRALPDSKWEKTLYHYIDVIMTTMASQITSLTIVYSIVYSDADRRKYQSSVSLAFVWGIHRGPLNSPHKGPVTRKKFPFDDVIMCNAFFHWLKPSIPKMFLVVPTCDFAEQYLHVSIYLYWYYCTDFIHNISFSVGGIQSIDSV